MLYKVLPLAKQKLESNIYGDRGLHILCQDLWLVLQFCELAVFLCYSRCGWPISHLTWLLEAAHLIHINLVINCSHKTLADTASRCQMIFFFNVFFLVNPCVHRIGFFVSISLCFSARTGCFLFILWNSCCYIKELWTGACVRLLYFGSTSTEP